MTADQPQERGVGGMDVIRIKAGLRNIPPERRNNQILRDLTDAVAEVEWLRARVEQLERAAREILDGWDDDLPTQEEVDAFRATLEKPP